VYRVLYLKLSRNTNVKKWQQEIPLTICDVVRRISKDHLGQLVVNAYEQALSKKSFMDVLKDLKLMAKNFDFCNKLPVALYSVY